MDEKAPPTMRFGRPNTQYSPAYLISMIFFLVILCGVCLSVVYFESIKIILMYYAANTF